MKTKGSYRDLGGNWTGRSTSKRRARDTLPSMSLLNGTHKCRRILLCGILVTVFQVRPVLAAGAHPKPRPLSLTISGGVSLGAYEAGLLHYALAWLDANQRPFEVRLATGTSAGSINALLAVLTHCGSGETRLFDSLFWKTWIPLGFDELYRKSDVEMRSAFSRQWIDRTTQELAERWQSGADGSCDVVLGISATRVIPRNVEMAGGALQVPRVEEHFALHLQGRGPGKPPRLTNYVDAKGAGDTLLLPEGAGGEVPFAALCDLLLASSAFPLAFAPVELAHCVAARGHGPPRCPEAAVQKAYFIDGGLFDNTPLRQAAWLARTGLRDGPPGDRARWLDAPVADHRKTLADIRFAYVSPDVTTYPSKEETFRLEERTTLLQLLGQETQTFLTTARVKNLYTILEETPEISDQVFVAARHYPAASSPMWAFFGLFEREFRRYDFYLGMYDARRIITERVVPALPNIKKGAMVFPEDVAPIEPEAWQPFRCLQAAFADSTTAATACSGEALRNFRILIQTSLERIYEECSEAGTSNPLSGQEHCRRARDGQSPPQLPEVDAVPGLEWRQEKGESESAWVTRLLARRHFLFKDLGLTRDQAGEAFRRIRLKLGDLISSIAGRQPAGEGLAVERLGQVAANALVYVPPRHVTWVAFSREMEVGWSHGFPEWPGFAGSLNLHLALQVYGLYDLLSTEHRPWGLAPLVGVGGLLPFLSSATFQNGLFLRAGWFFASEDHFGTRSCGNPADNTLGACSRLTAQAGFYTSALEVLRLQLLLESFPALAAGQQWFWSLSPALGVQFVF